ncbi:MAG: cytochrome c biogenesis protein CcdA [Desulfobacterales bacterium]|nr:cytochrome c biogenesis protein CcdA [Desulfobacterales bacterium]
MPGETVSYSLALMEGLLSFFSPCILPLIPAYFTFITGYSLEELTSGQDAKIRGKVILSTLAYVSGFSFVFILLGASASFLGGLIYDYRDAIRLVGGVLIIALGVHLTGLIRIPGLEFEKRLQLKKKPLHFMGTFLVGMAFAAGWSPCIGPMLGSILIIAGSQETIWEGMALLGVYSAGLAAPFLIISIFINFILAFLKKATRVLRYVNWVAGGLLVLLGILLLTNRLVF